MPKRKYIAQITPKSKKAKLQRASETAEKRECRLEKARVAAAASRARENEEQRERRLRNVRAEAARQSVRRSELMRAKVKLQRASEVVEEQECRLEKMQVAAAASWDRETEEQRERQLRILRAEAARQSLRRSELMRAKVKFWRASEKRECRLEQIRVAVAASRARGNEEQRERRFEDNRIHAARAARQSVQHSELMRAKRASEAAEERLCQLEKMRVAAAASRARENEEQRERKLKVNRIRAARARAARQSVGRSELVHAEFNCDPHLDEQNYPDPLIAKVDEIRRRCSAKKYEVSVEHGMTARTIVRKSVQDSTAGRNLKATSESSDFQQVEFWMNGVKRTFKIPLHSEVELSSKGSGDVINVDPGDIDEVHPCSFSADTIVIDPDVNDESLLPVSLSHKESVLPNSVALDAVRHFQNDKDAVSHNNQSNTGQNDQITINPARLSSAKRSNICDKRKTLKVRTELENIRSLHLPTFDATTHINQSITSQAQLRTDHRPVMYSYVTNSQSQESGLLVPSTVSKYGRQSVGNSTNSSLSVIPSELIKPSNSNTPLNMSDTGYKSLLQTVNSGRIPVIMTNHASQPLGRDGGQPVLLSSAASNGILTYVLEPQWQLNTTTSAN